MIETAVMAAVPFISGCCCCGGGDSSSSERSDRGESRFWGRKFAAAWFAGGWRGWRG